MKAKPEIAAEWMPLDALSPWAENPRRNDKAVAKVAESIKRFGFASPIIVREEGMEIIAGHTRWAAAKKLGLDRVPVRTLKLDPAEARLLALADNKLGEVAEWDDDQLRKLLAEVSKDDAELAGWGQDELDALMGEASIVEGQTDPDDAPEAPASPRSVLGDVWLCGKHRVMCGDSTSVDAVGALMAGVVADLVWTDPPYGVSYVGGVSHDPKYQKKREAQGMKIENDALNDDELTDFLRASLGTASTHCRDGAAWYVAAPAGPLFHCFGTVLKDLDVWRHTLNWIKSAFVFGRCDYHYQHEPIFYGWKPGAAHTWAGDRKQSSTLNFDRPKGSENPGHPTAKPVELVEYCIGNSSDRGDVVLEPFGGSGTTLIACEKTGRVARLMELDPRYVDVIVKRWQDYTGKKATREADGVAFDEA